MAALGADLRSEMGARRRPRSEMAAIGADLRSEMGALDTALRLEMERLRGDLFREQRNQTVALIGANTALAALVVAVIQLL